MVWPEVEMTRGDTPTLYYKLYDADAEDPTDPLNLEGYTVMLTVKPAVDDDDTDADAVLQHYLVIDGSGDVTASAGMRLGGIDPDTDEAVTGAASGVITHRIPSADSTALDPGTYVYDIQVRGPELADWDDDHDYDTPIRAASWVVLPDVTRLPEPDV